MIKKITLKPLFLLITLISTFIASSQVTLETEIKITDLAMFFDGSKVPLNTTTNNPNGYDYVYGNALTPHGDCIKVYDKYVFMTWYRGGKQDRHVMLTRYNTETGTMKTIEFPHQHTGYNGNWWIGETHNTIAVGICPKDGTIHMVYDMHRNGNVAAFANDYLRYSYSVANAATVVDDQFTIDLFVQSPNNNYKHLAFPGINDVNTTKLLTYPAFFTNDQGDLFLKNRFGYSENGKFLFAKYDGTDWEGYTDFNRMQASSYGSPYNWGLYGDIKYVNGKIRIGFQQRANIKTDKYIYQNGFYYAYSDDPNGLNSWKDHQGNGFTRPLAVSDVIKISEPGDLVATTQKDKVYMVGGFDWTVTDNEDIHFIGEVKDNENNVKKYVHTYKPFGATEFITSTDFSGADALYASGNYIYIIGLNSSGRPYIERALGGTNDFSVVYQQTSGKRFRKGQVHIENGKLYYYLLENNTTDNDDTQPTYLQIIDLNIVEGPQPFSVSLLSPSNNESFEEGQQVQFYANATADTGEISKVAFMVDGSLLVEDTTKPYVLNWTAQGVGNHTIQAIAYKDNGDTIATEIITFQVTEVDYTDLTGDVYRLRNAATGMFLVYEGGGGNPLSMNISGDTENKHFTFVESGDFYNIVGATNTVVRSTGSAFAAGAYLVVSTTKAPTTADTDKVWNVYYNEEDETYRFEAGNNGRFLYHDADGYVYTKDVDETDLRSKWLAISTSISLSTRDLEKSSYALKVYPNPAQEHFNIVMKNAIGSTVEIYNVLGALVHREVAKKDTIKIEKNNGFTSGIYLIKVTTSESEILFSKGVIK